MGFSLQCGRGPVGRGKWRDSNASIHNRTSYGGGKQRRYNKVEQIKIHTEFTLNSHGEKIKFTHGE